MVNATIEKGTLVIRVPVTGPTPSRTGKTKVIATTHGNQPSSATVKGQTVIIGMTAYIKDSE